MLRGRNVRSRASMLLVVILAVGVVTPATAVYHDLPEFRAERAYFSCEGQPSRIGNIGRALGTLPGWSTDAPTRSFTSGAGCGFADSGAMSLDDPSWEGTFTGNLSRMVVDLHYIAPQSAAFSTIALEVGLAVDGAPFTFDEPYIDVYPTPGTSGLSHSIRFALTRLNVIDEAGFGTVEHTYRFSVGAYYLDSGAAIAIAWGATEFPSGLTFNGDVSGLRRLRA